MAAPIFLAAALLAGRSKQTKPMSGKSFGAARPRCNVIQNIQLSGSGYEFAALSPEERRVENFNGEEIIPLKSRAAKPPRPIRPRKNDDTMSKGLYPFAISGRRVFGTRSRCS
jgi:hypothetical protein